MLAKLTDFARHPSHALSSACEQQAHSRRVKRYSILSIILVAFGVYTFISMFPEMRRYVLIKRM